jgi:hypothetical protein
MVHLVADMYTFDALTGCLVSYLSRVLIVATEEGRCGEEKWIKHVV